MTTLTRRRAIARACAPAAIALVAAVTAPGFGAAAEAASATASVTSWPLTPRAVSGLPGTPVPAHLPGATSASGAQCRNYYFPVTESASSTTVYQEFGQLCTMDPAKLGTQPIQVLIQRNLQPHLL